MTTKDEIKSYIIPLNLEERKQGYQQILTEFLMREADGRFYSKDDSKVLAYLLHKLPYFLSNDLEDFKEAWFWDKVLEHEPYVNMLFDWFKHGVKEEKSKYQTLKKMQEICDNEKAE